MRKLLAICLASGLMLLAIGSTAWAVRPGAGGRGGSGPGAGPRGGGPNLGGGGGGNLGARNLGERSGAARDGRARDAGGPGDRAIGSGTARDNVQQFLGIQGQAGARAEQLRVNLSSGVQPFSPAWYADHPAAWQATHPHADAAAVATFAAATAWLGWAATAPVAGYTTGYSVSSDDVTTTPEQNEQATQLAAAGLAATADGGEWLTLGNYALAPTNQTDATLLVQLAVNQAGTVRGTYYDLLAEQATNLAGSVDRTTQRVAWTVGPKGRVVFQSGLAELTQPQAPVTIHFENGRTKLWTMVRSPGLPSTAAAR